jgi:hypothetical protein
MADLSQLSTEDLIRLRRSAAAGAAPQGGGTPLPTFNVPAPPATSARNNADLANIGSTIGSRDVQNANVSANTTETGLDIADKRLRLQQAEEARAAGENSRRKAMTAVDAGLQAIRGARDYTGTFSTGGIGSFIGKPGRNAEIDSYDLADLPLVGNALYGNTPKSKLDTYLGTVNAGLTYDFLNDIRKEAASSGGGAGGVANTNLAEFLSLGKTQANVFDAQKAGPDVLNEQLNVAQEQLLRRKAALMVPVSQLVNATPDERKALLDAAYQRALDEYSSGAGVGSTFNGGGPAAPTSGTGPSPRTGAPSVDPTAFGAPSGQGGIATDSVRKTPDPALKGVNTTVAGMIRSGASTDDMVSLLRDRGVPITPELMSTLQTSAEFYRPYVGKQLPKNIQAPRVDIEYKFENVPLSSRIAGNLVDNPVGAFIVGNANGLLLGGLDEAVGMGNDQRTAEVDALKNYLSDNYGLSYGAGNIAGGVASFLPASRLAAGAIKAAPRAAAIGSDLLLGTTAGALENNEDRKTGAVLGLGASILGEAGGRFVTNRVLPRFMPAPSNAERVIADNVVDPNAARGILSDAERLNTPMSLADADPGLLAQAGSATRSAPQARTLADANIGGRDAGQSDRGVLAISENLAEETDVVKLGNTIRSDARAEAEPFKTQAFRQMAPVADPELTSILNTPAAKQGLANAREIAGNEQRNWKTLGVDLNDQGEVVLKEGASWESLDYVRRGIDSVIDTYRNDAGKLVYDRGGKLKGIVDARAALTQRMRDLNGNYGQYLDTLSGPLSNAEQIGFGAKALFSTKANAKQISEAVADLTPDQLRNYQIGAANALIDRMKGIKDNGDVFQLLRSPNMRERLAAIFPDKAGQLADLTRKTELEGLMRQTKTELLGGSPTGPRAVADEAFNAQANSRLGVLNTAVEGTAAVATGGISMLPALVRGGVLSFKNASKLEAVKNQQALAQDLAPILLETDPKKAKAALDGILAKVDTYDKAATKARRVGGSAGAATATGILTQ